MMDARYLPLLSEECAEVIQAVCKAERFGLADSHPDYENGKPNSEVILKEIGDVLGVLKMMLDGNGEEFSKTWMYADRKIQKLKIYGPDGTYLKSRAPSHRG